MAIDELFVSRRQTLGNLLRLRKNEKTEKSVECPNCKTQFLRSNLKSSGMICINCNYHFPMMPNERIELIADSQSFRELNKNILSRNPLSFPGYEEKVKDLRKKTGYEEAVVTGTCKIDGVSVALGIMNSSFLMGSMGTVVGEKITKLCEMAYRKKLPLILFCASGGARMQEGMFSLMQMAKTAGAIERFKDKGGLYISVLTNPTTGGVSASFATLGDIIIAEPKALIGFAGPRVIEQTIGQKLPEGFQRSEFLMEHGMVDMVVDRSDLRGTLSILLKMHTSPNQYKK